MEVDAISRRIGLHVLTSSFDWNYCTQMYRSGCPKSLYDDTTMILCGILFRCMERYLTLVNVNVIYDDAS